MTVAAEVMEGVPEVGALVEVRAQRWIVSAVDPADHTLVELQSVEWGRYGETLTVPVQPQVRRQTLRTRLDSRSKSIRQRILADLGLARAGFDISRAIKGARGNNADALYALLNRDINTFAGQGKKSRDTWTLDQLQAAYDSLDEIGDQLAETIRTAIEE